MLMTDQGTDEYGEILKTDVLGRVKIRPDRREAMVDAFEASGMSGQAFAIHHGIKVQTFASWIQKRRRSRGDYEDEATRSKLRMPAKFRTQSNPSKPTSSGTLNLIEVCVNAERSTDSASPVEVVLLSGVIVRISSENQISLLKSLLRQLPC